MAAEPIISGDQIHGGRTLKKPRPDGPGPILGCGNKKNGRCRALPIWQLTIALRGSVDEFLTHHFSVRPLLNGYLAHIERTPLGMISIDAVNNERLVARNHIAIANVGPHGLDLRKKVFFERATSCLTDSRRLLIFLHGHVVGIVAVESLQRLSTDDLSNQVLNCRLGGLCAHSNLLWSSSA